MNVTDRNIQNMEPPIAAVPPLEEDPWRGTSGSRLAEFAVIGETWGAEEERLGRPFVGASGRLLRAEMRRAGLDPSSFFWTNVANARPPRNDYTAWTQRGAGVRVGQLELAEPLLRGLRALRAQLEQLPRLRRVLLVGNLALWACTVGCATVRGGAVSGIMQWRGSQLYLRLPDGRLIEALPIVHPAAVLRQSEWILYLRADLHRFATVQDWAPPEEDFRIRPSLREALDFLDAAEASPGPLAVDVEVRHLHLSCIGLSYQPRQALCIPFVERGRHYWSEEEELLLRRRLRQLLARHPRIVGQNFIFDVIFLRRELLVVVDCWLDTLVAHHLLFPGTPRGLDFLSSLYCDHHVYWKDDRKLWATGEDEDTFWLYNCRDASKTREIALVLKRELERAGMWHLYEEERRHTWRLARDMSLRGMRFASERQSALAREVAAFIAHRAEALQRIAPHLPQWWRSPKKTKQLFYEDLGLPPQRSRKTGSITTGKEALPELPRRAPEHLQPFVAALVRWLAEMRSAQQWANVFLRAPADPDGRFRSVFDPAGTATFRFSSDKNPFSRGANMQNLPKEKEA